MKKLLNNKLLFGIISIGLILRILNPTFGTPVLYTVGDEASTYLSALYMLKNKTIFSTNSQYPPLNGYIQLPFLVFSFALTYFLKGFTSFKQFSLFLLTHEGYFLFIPRIISAVFGTAIIYYVYKITKLIYPNNKAASLLASLIYAGSLLNIQVSHFGRPWTPALFFFSISIYYLIKSTLTKSNSKPYTLLSSLALGISSGFLQIGFFAIGFYIFFYLFIFNFNLSKLLKKTQYLKGLGLSISLTLIFYLLTKTKPSISFFAPISSENLTFLQQIFFLLKNNSFLSLIIKFILTEPISFTAIIIYFIQINKSKRIHKAILYYSFIYLILISFFSYGAVRYLTFVIVLISPIVGYQLSLILNAGINIKFYRYLIFCLLLVIIFIPAVCWNIVFLRKPTFILAREYIDNNINPSVPIASNSFRFLGYTPNLYAINLTQNFDKSYYQTLKNELQNSKDLQITNNRNIIYLEKISSNMESSQIIKNILKEEKTEYLIYIYFEKNLLTNILSDKKSKTIQHFSPGEKDVIEYNSTNLTDVTIPYLLSINRAGPFIDIIKVN